MVRGVLEDVFEALIGAMYKTFGHVIVRDFVLSLLAKHATVEDFLVDTNHKDRLVRHLRARTGSQPTILYTSSDIPTGGGYLITLIVNGVAVSTAAAKTKKDAEQLAAKAALDALGVPTELITSKAK
jgi:ribonuclease-3